MCLCIFMSFVVYWSLFFFVCFFFFSSRRRHTRLVSDWSSDVCSSDLIGRALGRAAEHPVHVGRIDTVRERQGASLVVRNVTLDPHLSVRDLRAHRRFGVLGEIRMPEGVVADLIAVTGQELELLAFEGRL